MIAVSGCKICGAEVFGYGGDVRMPLCKEHYLKTLQLVCYYYEDREDCPYEGTDAEWEAVREIATGKTVAE